MTVPPDGLERLLKSLEGHVVESVDLKREDGFLHVKLSVIELDPQYAPRGGYPLASKVLSFTVMWKRTVDRMFEGYNKQLEEILSNLKETESELGETLEDLKKEV